MSNLHALRRIVSRTLVVAARKWRRASHGVLAAFSVSEACATPLLTVSRLGEAAA
ncbi:MarR family transcriptional regulator [Paraburkholderia caffeinilytica]|nr:MarR family transcriptional regulator [Paraburkholderia caffeinilytica]